MFQHVLRSIFAAAALFVGTCATHAGPVLLYETKTDRVLYAEDADQPWYAASLTKMMTAYLVFEAWQEKRATKESIITISAKARAQPKMRLGLKKGKTISFEDALKALVMVSANDIAYAIAETLSGTEEEFVAQMNAKAKKLGMSGTRFINPHGLPGEDQYTTAQDMARLASALMRDYPEHMHYFALAMTEIGEKKKRTIATYNPALIHIEGGDGFKTGFTCSAGYNIVASASRDGQRIIAIIMGEKSSSKRSVKAQALLEYGFKMLDWKLAFPAPTIHSLPGGTYNREQILEANLDQRIMDCTARELTPEQLARFAKKHPKAAAAVAKAMEERAKARADKPNGQQITTGSIKTNAAATAKVNSTPGPVKTVPNAAPTKSAPAMSAAVPQTPTVPAAGVPAKRPAAVVKRSKKTKRKTAKNKVRPTEGIPFLFSSP